jgi:hypothetical protein
MDTPDDPAARLESLERQVAALSVEVARLRGMQDATPAQPPPPAPRRATPEMDRMLSAAERLYAAATHRPSVPLSGDEIESYVGRYGTLAFAALALLMGVGMLVTWAVAKGLLTATMGVGLGALTALALGVTGLWFRARGEVRYGDVLLAIALAIVDLVAWGAGPRLGLVSPSVALLVVVVVAVGIATLALRDENEFLFIVAVGGALSAPFVTWAEPATTRLLLAYGATVVLGAILAVRDARWTRAAIVLVAAATAYALTAAALPVEPPWYGPYLVVGFAGACAAGALALGRVPWRGTLARALLAVGLLGVPLAWDRAAATAPLAVALIALSLAVLTQVALAWREPGAPGWRESALLLPLLSLGVAYPAADGLGTAGAVLALWTAISLAAWLGEGARGEPVRGAVHLLAGGLLGALAIVEVAWSSPLGLVAGLAAWGVVLAAAAGRSVHPMPMVAVAMALGGAGLSALDQLASRPAYSFVPFSTRSSASALCATLGLALASELLGREQGGAAGAGIRRWADRPLRLGIVVGFAIVWGRMELAHAFSLDLATFLLTLYYAACGVATIVAGRYLGVQRLRMTGLAMSIYAALKAMVEAAAIEGIALRVGIYGAVGAFLLGAGYLYRVRRDAPDARPPLTP